MLAASCLVALASTVADAQQPAAAAPAADQGEELAKKLSNPISDLVSVPLQFNWQQKVGPLELSQFILNFQPVMPFELNEHWNLIARVIMPFIGQPPFLVNGIGENGIGDIDASFFFSPRSTSGSHGRWDRYSPCRPAISRQSAADMEQSVRRASPCSKQESGRLEHW
jgi:hypothetical protein